MTGPEYNSHAVVLTVAVWPPRIGVYINFMRMYMNMDLEILLQIRIYIHIYICTSTSIYLHIYICVYIYICIYLCEGQDWGNPASSSPRAALRNATTFPGLTQTATAAQTAGWQAAPSDPGTTLGSWVALAPPMYVYTGILYCNYTCVYIYTYTCVNTYVYMYMYLFMYMHAYSTYLCVCVYTYTYLFRFIPVYLHIPT